MKTFSEFLLEASTTQKLKLLVSKRLKERPSNTKVYKNLLASIRKREKSDTYDYPGRESARRDKTLIPSGRTSSFPELEGISTKTKNPKKLRKQRAIGEIT